MNIFGYKLHAKYSKRGFVDTNIVIDLLCERYPWFPKDALQYCSAQTVNADCIVTRNKKDFSASEIPAYELDEFLEMMEK